MICEVCYNNVVDELSARKGETVCKLCKKEIEKINRYKIKIKKCKVCGLEGTVDLFKKDSLTCKKCYAEKTRNYRHAHPEKEKEYRERNAPALAARSHKYYLEHKEESLERTRRNRAKKKQCT
ncbi:MAG: hypothetical protein PHQ67_03980 [Fermentimonas sp.]|nr:hypothetical protein [Fermentimonas sp.]